MHGKEVYQCIKSFDNTHRLYSEEDKGVSVTVSYFSMGDYMVIYICVHCDYVCVYIEVHIRNGIFSLTGPTGPSISLGKLSTFFV